MIADVKAFWSEVEEDNRRMLPHWNQQHIISGEPWECIINDICLPEWYMMMGPYSTIYKGQCKKPYQLRLENVRFWWHQEAWSRTVKGPWQSGGILSLWYDNFVGFQSIYGPICNRLFLLDDFGVHLVVRSICMNIEWYIVVELCHEDIYSQNSFQYLKCFVHF